MIYLDNAATSYKKPDCVLRAVFNATLKNSANAGRGGYKEAVESSEILYRARENLAALFGILNPERIVFCSNTTDALNKGVKGVVKRGDHIITTTMEHNSVIRPIKALERCGVTCSYLTADENGETDVNRLKGLIRRDTRLIVMTHASNVCGNIYDIEKASQIARDNGVLFMVDAAQSAGSVPLDARFCDLIAFPGHKGLLGPMGTGGLYVGENVKIAPIIEGGTGSLSESLTQPDFFPDALESGTQNIPCIAGLSAAAEFLMKTGIENIKKHEMELLHRFEEGIKNIDGIKVFGGKNKCAICTFNIADMDSVLVSQRLYDEYGIATRSGLHCAYLAHKSLGTQKGGTVRASFGIFNTKKEVDSAIDAIYKIRKSV